MQLQPHQVCKNDFIKVSFTNWTDNDGELHSYGEVFAHTVGRYNEEDSDVAVDAMISADGEVCGFDYVGLDCENIITLMEDDEIDEFIKTCAEHGIQVKR